MTTENQAPEGGDRQALQELFEPWWEKSGQFCRAGGGGYEKTFAFYAWEAALRFALAARKTPPLAGTPPRADYVKAARVYALAYGLHDDAPSYLPRTQADADTFEPHAWVIGAMMQAFGDGWADGHAAGLEFMKDAAKCQAPAEGDAPVPFSHWPLSVPPLDPQPKGTAIGRLHVRREYHEYEGSAKEDPEGYIVAQAFMSDPARELPEGWHEIYAAPQAVASSVQAPAPAPEPVELPPGLSRSDAEFWLRKRGEIIDALRAEGLTMVTTLSGVRFMRLGKIEAQTASISAPAVPHGKEQP